VNILEIDSVTKRFGGLIALNDVSFSVRRGEILGVIGANGAGKTTLFSVLSGFYSPDRGRVTLYGSEITGMKPYRICRLGLVRTFQVVRPFRKFTVLENAVVGKMFGRDRLGNRKEAIEKARHTLGIVGLAGKEDALSGGLGIADHKRLELARALMTDPKVLLLDEVLAGLTPAETAEAMEILRRVHKEMNLTILMVEHVMKAVMGLCRRVLVLHYGAKLGEGAPEEILRDEKVIKAYLGDDLEY